jgi:hypothetical protein
VTVTKIPQYNPYGQVARQIRALLRLEVQYPPEIREKFEWMLRVDVLGKPLVVGRGGANTIFWAFGDRERELAFPDPALSYFDRLARQAFVAYDVHSEGKRRRRYDREKALALPPIKGGEIYGRGIDGSRVLAYRARRTMSKTMKWMPCKN